MRGDVSSLNHGEGKKEKFALDSQKKNSQKDQKYKVENGQGQYELGLSALHTVALDDEVDSDR